jgi:hypothetical protein
MQFLVMVLVEFETRRFTAVAEGSEGLSPVFGHGEKIAMYS